MTHGRRFVILLAAAACFWRLPCGLLRADPVIASNPLYERGTQNYRDWLRDQQSGYINEDTPQQRDTVGQLLRTQYPTSGNCVGCLWEFLMYAMSEIPASHPTHPRPEAIRVVRRDGRIYVVQFLGPAPERRVLYEFYPDAPQSSGGQTGVLFRMNASVGPADPNYRIPQKFNPQGNRGFGEILDMQGTDLTQARSALASFTFFTQGLSASLPAAPLAVGEGGGGGSPPPSVTYPPLRAFASRDQTAQAGDLYWSGILLMRRGSGDISTDQEQGKKTTVAGVVWVHNGHLPDATGHHSLQVTAWHLYTMSEDGSQLTHFGGYGTHIEIVMNDSTLKENGTRVDLNGSLHSITVQGQPQSVMAFRYAGPQSVGSTFLYQYVTAQGQRYDTQSLSGTIQVVSVASHSRPYLLGGRGSPPAPLQQQPPVVVQDSGSGQQSSLAGLRAFLRDRPGGVTFASFANVPGIEGANDLVEPLMAALRQASMAHTERAAVAGLLVRIGAQGRTALRQLLLENPTVPNTQPRVYAARALGGTSPPADDLRALLTIAKRSGEASEVLLATQQMLRRTATITAIGNLLSGEADAVACLTSVLNGGGTATWGGRGTDEMRLAAVGALARMGLSTAGVSTALTHARDHDSSADVRRAAGAALGLGSSGGGQPQTLEQRLGRALAEVNLYSRVDTSGDLRNPPGYPNGTHTVRWLNSLATNFARQVEALNISDADLPAFWSYYVAHIPNPTYVSESDPNDPYGPSNSYYMVSDSDIRTFAGPRVRELLSSTLRNRIVS